MAAPRTGRWKLALAVVVFLPLGVWVFREPLMRRMGWALVETAPPRKAGAVVVLAGGAGGERILLGAELVRKGFAPVVYMSGPYGWYEQTECEAAVPLAVRHGYPASYFRCVPNTAHSTREEAEFVLQQLRKDSVPDFLLVTTEFHTARASRVYRDSKLALPFTTVAANSIDMDMNRWWESRDGMRTIYFEWSKTVAYWFGL